MPLFRTAAPLALLITALALTPAITPAALAADEIVVRAGDTLTGIAKRLGVTVPSLVAANSIADPNRIYVGQRLLVPGSRPALPPAAHPSTPAAGGLTHTVSRGENLWSIARFYGVSLSALISANGIGDPRRIHAGLQLLIPGAAAAPPAAPAAPAAPPPASAPAAPPAQAQAARVHVVSRGENLWSIARFYGVSLSELVGINGITDPRRIHAGLQLTIPGGAPTAPASPAPAPPPSPVPAPAPAMSPWMAAAVAQRADVRQIITEEATAVGVPVALALAVAWQESGWRQNAVSSAGAIGIMQLMPSTAVWVGQSMLGRAVNINDARDNVRAGVRLLAHYLQRYDGNRHLVLAAYYQGQGAADRHGVYAVTRPYIASVEALVRLFGG